MVDLKKNDIYEDYIVPDEDVETTLKVLRTLRNSYLMDGGFDAGKALLLSQAHECIFEIVLLCCDPQEETAPTNTGMKSYCFEAGIFGYFALIGAHSEEEAVNFYNEVVGDLERDNVSPDELTREEAVSKIINQANYSYEEAEEHLNSCLDVNEVILILLDADLLS